MSKVLVMPDVHLKTELIKRIGDLLDHHPDWTCVSLGDWADDWGRSPEDYEIFFHPFLEFCQKYRGRLHLCWGNHDYGYWSYPGHHSGYVLDAASIVRHYLTMIQLQSPINVLYLQDGVIFSHAGLTKGLFANYKRRLHRLPSHSFIDFANTRTPQEYWQGDSPLWHRPADNLQKNTFNPWFLQVVGHTPVPTVTYTGEDNILYTDTWSTDNRQKPLGDKSLAVVDTNSQTWEVMPYDD